MPSPINQTIAQATPGQPDPLNINPGNYLGHTTIGQYGFAITHNGQIQSPDDKILLTLNPQGFDQNEEAAVTLTPMQGGSKLRERRGNIFKDISLQGTTGFLPQTSNPVIGPFTLPPLPSGLSAISNAVSGALGTPSAAIGNLAGFSGYAEFLVLRGMFRKYWDIHRLGNPSERQGVDFVFFNPKDLEFWIVEPLSFRMTRDRGSPMLYRYQIAMKTIAPFTQSIPTDVLERTQTPLNGLLGFVQAAGTIANTIRQFSTTLRQFLNSFPLNVQALANSILGVADAVTNSISDIAGSTGGTFIDVPVNLVSSISSTAEGFFRAANAVSVDMNAQAAEAVMGLAEIMDNLAARTDLFQQQWEDRYSAAIQLFSQTYGLGGDASAITNATQLNGVTTDTVLQNETLYGLATRTTKDPNNALAIIVLNSLVYPYLSPSAQERAPNTLAPGDQVLIPTFQSVRPNQPLDPVTTNSAAPTNPSFTGQVGIVTGSMVALATPVNWRPNQWTGFGVTVISGVGFDQSALVSYNTSNEIIVGPWRNPDGTLGTGPSTGSVITIFLEVFVSQPKRGIEELLGVDLLLTSDFDIALTAVGDWSTVAGEDNFDQAIDIKFRTIQGDLVANQWFGLAPPFGEKGTPDNVFAFRYNAAQTLLSDSRVQSVDQMQVSLTDDQLSLSARVAVVGSGYQQINTRV